MIVKFWGVRGSIPSGNKETVGVGGNTTCVEVRCGNEIIIFDSGTGIRNLAKDLMKKNPVKGKIFYTHVHWDHIQGLPFFTPLFVKANEFDIYGGTSMPVTIKEILDQQMSSPCFPVRMDIMAAKIRYHDLQPGDVVKGENYQIRLIEVYHPNRTYAYRVESGNQSVVFATDVEPDNGKSDERLLKFSQGVDLLIYDSQYTEDEYRGLNGNFSRLGWGHSTMPEAVKLAKGANVKQLILFHHDPTHDDNFIKQFEREARTFFPQSTAAYEGMEIDLDSSIAPKSLFD